MRRKISPRLRFQILERDLFRCRYCGAKAPDTELVVDHIRPVAAGGDNDPENLCTACEPCNRGKAALELEEPIYEFIESFDADMLESLGLLSHRRDRYEITGHVWDLAKLSNPNLVEGIKQWFVEIAEDLELERENRRALGENR